MRKATLRIRGDAGDDARDPGDAADRRVRVDQLRHFEHGRAGDDHGRRDEEREMRRLAVVEADEQPAHHGRARARDAGDERRALPQADDERLAPAHARRACARRRGAAAARRRTARRR